MRHSFWVFLPLCLLGSLLTAVVFVVGMTAGLPPTDGAYGTNPFGDPFVVVVMMPFVLVAALLVWPFVYFALRYTNLDRTLPLVSLFTVAWTGAIAYWVGPAALFLSFVGLGASLVFCWKSPWARHGASVEGGPRAGGARGA